jgi:uncharacterized membrane protein
MTNDKEFEDLTPEESKELKIEFAPGCFDSFEGTQEELDELINSIKEMFASGEAVEKARRLDFDDLDEEDLEVLEHLASSEGRTLQ